MKGKVVLLTGGNAGIGKAAAIGIAKQGATVIITSRNLDKANTAVADIRKASNNDNVSALQVDFARLDTVRKLADNFLKEYDRLDVLVNNAGIYFSDYAETPDGIERQFQINHLAPFLLTNLLLDTIKKSAPSRIVFVSSRAHQRFSNIDFNNLGFKDHYDGFFKAYGQSKLGNVFTTYELAERLKGTGVTVNALHPGVINTGIAQKNSNFKTRLVWGLLSPFMTTPEKGAATTVFLATSPKVEGVTGKYFYKSKEVPSSQYSHNEEVRKKLWSVSEMMTGLD